MKLWVVGGRMRPAGALDRDHEPLYDEGRVVCLDTAQGHAEVVFAWRSQRFSQPGLGHCFKGARWDGDALLLCSEREVLRVDPLTWQIVRRWSHPWFNDLHDAISVDGRLVVASTGLDAVITLAEGDYGERVRGVAGPVWAKEGVDYRTISTKPHQSHPNHLFVHRGRIWVTRLLQGDAVTVDPPVLRLPIQVGPLHDGFVRGDRAWFTVVDGRLVEGDLERLETARVVPLDGRDGGPLGWCRGLHIHGERAFVGFSRLRTTQTRAYLARIRGWIRGEQRATDRPTRVVEVDLRGGQLGSWALDTVGLDAIFSILPAAPPSRSPAGAPPDRLSEKAERSTPDPKDGTHAKDEHYIP